MSVALAAMFLLGVLIGAALQYGFNRHIEGRELLLPQKALACTHDIKAVAGLTQRTTERFTLTADEDLPLWGDAYSKTLGRP